MDEGSRTGAASGAYVEARALLDAQLADQPHNPEAVFWLARLDSKTGRPLAAAAAYFNLVESDPAHHSAIAGLAYVLRYAGFHDTSIALYALLVEQQSAVYGASRAWSQTTKNHLYTGDYASAHASDLAMYAAIRDKGEAVTEKHLFYSGLVAAYRGDAESAHAFWRASEALRPNTVWSNFAASYAAAFAGDPITLESKLAWFEALGVQDGERYYRFVHLHALGGNSDAAAMALAGTLQRGFFPIDYWRNDPWVSAVVQLPATEALFAAAESQRQAFFPLLQRIHPWLETQTTS